MYKPDDERDGIGAGLSVAAPAFAPLPEAAPAAAPARDWRSRIERRFHQLDIAHDLAEEIGTGRWYRGFATMLGLGVLALAFWPDFSSVEAATTVRPDAAMRTELHAQAIAPLGLGGDSGRQVRAGTAVAPLASVPESTTVQLVATLGEGDSVVRMLQRAGAGAYDASQASEMIAAVMTGSTVKPGTRFSVTLGPREEAGASRPLDKLSFRARFDLDLDLAIERSGGSLGISKHPVAVDATPLRVRGTVGTSLFRSARAAGAPMKAIEQYLQTIAAHLSLDGDMAPTDQFDMIVSYKRTAGGENEVGDLVYAGLERDGKPIAELVRWKDGQFVDAVAGPGAGTTSYGDRPLISGQGFVQPVNGHMTSGYGLRRHPILGYVRMHAGIDFGAAYGSPIFAVSDGVVSFAGRHGGHGNYVRIEHGGGLGTGYGHMSRIAVLPGSKVHAGEVIGYVGSSGLSTGPHLHYEVYENGRTVNPLSVNFGMLAPSFAAGFDKVSTGATTGGKGQADALKDKIAALKRVAPGAALQKLAPKYAPIKGKAVKAATETD